MAFLRHKRQPGARRFTRGTRFQGLAADGDAAALRATEAEDGFEQFGAPRSDQAEKPDDFTRGY